MLVCDCPPCPFSPLSVQAVLAELQQADLITSEDCEGLSDVVSIQSDKSDEVMGYSAVVPKRHGFEEESRLLAGKQTYSSVCQYSTKQNMFMSHIEYIHLKSPEWLES